MVIRLDENYNAMTSTALLGYVGETNARPVLVEGMEIDGADRYVLTIDYGDGTVYEVDITGVTWTPTADILRSAQTVSCQICAKKLSGQEYILLKKSRIFRLRIGAAIGDTAIPTPDVSMDALDRIDAIGTQVAADRKAAETAAQTAQSIADSLPDDYTTAVGKIAENTAEISAVKLTDKELQRRINALYDMGNGVTHQFETDTDTAYQKTVPTGAKLMSVKSVGGKSVVWNQIFEAYSGTNNGVTVTTEADGTITLNGTAESSYIYFKSLSSAQNKIGKYILKLLILNNPDSVTMRYAYFNRTISTPTATKGTAAALVNQTAKDIELQKVAGLSGFTTGTVFNDVKIKIQIFDLTQMFGSGNEPSTVEEFESMFPNGYYPYNEGTLMSMSVNNVENVGKNLFDCYGFSSSAILDINAERRLTNSYGTTISTIEPSNKLIVTQSQATGDSISHANNGWFCIGVKGMKSSKNYVLSFDFTATKALRDKSGLLYLINGRYPQALIEVNEINVKKRIAMPFEYMALDDRQYIEIRLCGLSGIFENFQIEEGSSMTAYSPYKKETYAVPQSILNLEGYGWSSGTARNYVDYENKKYYKCVDSMDLGMVNWQVETSPTFGTYFSTFVDSRKFKKIGDFTQKRHNILCDKYLTVKRDVKEYVDKTILLDGTVSVVTQIQVKDTVYSDAATFKQAMQGVMLYYELANPIITDISTLIDDDFLRNIEVEAGGTITFKNSNSDSYRIPVPSKEEYIVKLSEIGGTT